MLEWLRKIFVRDSRLDLGMQIVEAPGTERARCAEDEFALGKQYFAQGRFEEAARAFSVALEVRHDWSEAHHCLGLCLHRLGRFEDACDCYELALHFRPDFSQALLSRAYAERKRGQNEAALASVQAAVALGQDTVETCNLEGALRLDIGDVPGAISAFERAVAIDPDDPDANSNLGYLLFRDRAQYERGARHIERALELSPDNLGYLCNYTLVLAHRKGPEQTLDLCDRILARRPEMDEVRLNRGLALLKLGRFDTGWRDYEARKSVRCNYVARDLPWPEWQGEALDGKTLLIYGEQGLGDEIMFASCFGDMMQRAAHCVIECEARLEPLFRRSFPTATVVAGVQARTRTAWQGRVPSIDVQVAAGSLPLHLRCQRQDFPAHRGYLEPDPERTRRWRQRLDELGPGLKIGVSWRGGLQSTRQDLRSIGLASFAKIFEVSGLHFVDLQYGDTRVERARLEAERASVLHSWPGVAGDLDELAALLSELDLVVSVCTAVIHLAGALGRDVWVLVPSVPEWRYQQQGTSLPWYPTARLIRQRRDGDWSGVLDEVSHDLRRVANTGR